MKEQSLVFTPEGIKSLTAEWEQLKTEREEKQRMDSGVDLSFLNERIEELEGLLANAEEVDGTRVDGVIGTGAVVKLRDSEFAEALEYMLVNRYEADPLQKKVSEESPIGRALKGKKAGDSVKVEGPGGLLSYEVVAVEYRD